MFYVPSAKKTSVEQASAASQTEQTTHSYSSLNHAFLLIVVRPAVAAHVSVTATAAAIKVTCSWLTHCPLTMRMSLRACYALHDESSAHVARYGSCQ